MRTFGYKMAGGYNPPCVCVCALLHIILQDGGRAPHDVSYILIFLISNFASMSFFIFGTKDRLITHHSASSRK